MNNKLYRDELVARIERRIIMNNKLYRDELVARIKDAGQELIDRAEQMVSENTDLISSFSIYLKLDTEDSIPSIKWSTEVINKNSYNRFTKGE